MAVSAASGDNEEDVEEALEDCSALQAITATVYVRRTSNIPNLTLEKVSSIKLIFCKSIISNYNTIYS